GGYQRIASTVRVTARITDVATSAVLRTVKEDGSIEEIFALQDRVVSGLSEGFRGNLVPAVRGGEETHVVEAYEAFARGVLNLRLETYEALDRAVLFFERAV